jgi:calcineurin-like phosphoesterase family protein
MLFFTSDEHYGHKNIVRYCNRPFADVTSMNLGLIANHNNRVRADDDVWHLGDFSMAPGMLRQILPKLNGRHRLVAGNHDMCHPCHGAKSARFRDEYVSAGFIEVVERAWLDLPAPIGRAFLCHMPPAGANPQSDEKYLKFRPTQEEIGDAWLIHGHVHNLWQRRGRALNVGVDVWGYKPVTAFEIAKLAAANESTQQAC